MGNDFKCRKLCVNTFASLCCVYNHIIFEKYNYAHVMSVHHVVVSSRSKSLVEAHEEAPQNSTRRRATYVIGSSQGSSTSVQEGFSKQQQANLVTGKVLLLGDSGVGKTCLLVRFRDGRFLYGSYISTVGIDFRSKVVTVDDAQVKLQIWDTAGQERFRSVTHAYYRDAHALLLLYDVTNKTSFDNIRAWLGEIREYAQDDVVIMLLGNKSDCGSEREVRREDGERLGREYNVIFLETSAKTGLNVELAFSAVARELLSRSSTEGAPANGGIDVHDPPFSVQDYIREHSQRATGGATSACAHCST